MSIGLGLLKCLVENNTPITELYNYGIDDSFFESEREKRTLHFIKNFRINYGKYPEIKTIEKECSLPRFKDLPTEPLQYWITKIKERKQANILAHLTNKLQHLIPKGDLDSSLKLLDEANLALKNIESPFKIKDLSEVAEAALMEHFEVQNKGDELPGITFGFSKLDELTGGAHGGDFIFIVGETGVNKSYVSLYMGLSAYKAGHNIMFISPEMVEKQIGRRALALNGHIEDRLIKRGQLSYYAVQKLIKIIKEMKGMDNWFKILPSGMFTDIHDIVNAVIEYNPDMLIVDGIYLLNNSKLRTNSPWREDESIIFLLRELALKQDIPIICTTQYSRSGKNKREGARGTQSVEQTTTLFLSLEFEYEDDKEMAKPVTTRLLKIKKGRDGERMVLRLILDFNKTTIEEDDVLSGPAYLMQVEDNEEDDTPVEDL